MAKAKKPPTKLSVVNDTLAQLEAKRMKPLFCSGYLRLPTKVLRKLFKVTIDESGVCPLHSVSGESIQVQKIIKQAPCEVCGIGSLLFSYIDKYNQVELDRGVVEDSLFMGRIESVDLGKTEVHFTLSELFSSNELDMIEEAFEDGEYGFSKYKSAYKRLHAILTHMKENGGTFVGL